MSNEGENSHRGNAYRQSLLLDGEITSEGNAIRIPLRCLNCKKEILQAMFADRFPNERVKVDSVEHPHSTYGSPSALKMRRMIVEFEPRSTDKAAITKLFLELRDAGVQDIDRSTLSRAFHRLRHAPSAGAGQPISSDGAATWSAAITPSNRLVPSTDADGKTYSQHHF